MLVAPATSAAVALTTCVSICVRCTMHEPYTLGIQQGIRASANSKCPVCSSATRTLWSFYHHFSHYTISVNILSLPSPLHISQSPQSPPHLAVSTIPSISHSLHNPLHISWSRGLVVSQFPSFPVSQFPSFPVSQSPSLPVSQSPSLSVSQSRDLVVSWSRGLVVSVSPCLVFPLLPSEPFRRVRIVGKPFPGLRL
jgi:hypothetical protein